MNSKGRSEKRPRIASKTGENKKFDHFESDRRLSKYEDRPQRLRFDRKPHTDRLSEREESDKRENYKPHFEDGTERRKPGRPRKNEYGDNRFNPRDSKKFDTKKDERDNRWDDNRKENYKPRFEDGTERRKPGRPRKNEYGDNRFSPRDSKKFDTKKDERDNNRKNDRKFDSKNGPKRNYTKQSHTRSYERTPSGTGLIRLNKYLADSGVCSRREADTLITAGTVTVNGKVVSELGFKVKPVDVVTYDGRILRREKLRYLLLNKPKGYITTSDDPYERRTVMDLVANACEERLYPVGRLDRNTVGLLLMTNDGDLAKKLTHPKHGVRKLYHVTLDKPLTKNDLLKIAEGFDLEDGHINVDSIAWVADQPSKKEVGVELHSGKNRIVRRIFEHLGYEVIKLDRVMLGGLTKLGLERGHWRFLTDTEIGLLKKIK